MTVGLYYVLFLGCLALTSIGLDSHHARCCYGDLPLSLPLLGSIIYALSAHSPGFEPRA